jgi:hypothetical protein
MRGQRPSDYPLTSFSNVTPPAAAPVNATEQGRGDGYPADVETDAFERDMPGLVDRIPDMVGTVAVNAEGSLSLSTDAVSATRLSSDEEGMLLKSFTRWKETAGDRRADEALRQGIPLTVSYKLIKAAQHVRGRIEINRALLRAHPSDEERLGLAPNILQTLPGESSEDRQLFLDQIIWHEGLCLLNPNRDEAWLLETMLSYYRSYPDVAAAARRVLRGGAPGCSVRWISALPWLAALDSEAAINLVRSGKPEEALEILNGLLEAKPVAWLSCDEFAIALEAFSRIDKALQGKEPVAERKARSLRLVQVAQRFVARQEKGLSEKSWAEQAPFYCLSETLLLLAGAYSEAGQPDEAHRLIDEGLGDLDSLLGIVVRPCRWLVLDSRAQACWLRAELLLQEYARTGKKGILHGAMDSIQRGLQDAKNATTSLAASGGGRSQWDLLTFTPTDVARARLQLGLAVSLLAWLEPARREEFLQKVEAYAASLKDAQAELASNPLRPFFQGLLAAQEGDWEGAVKKLEAAWEVKADPLVAESLGIAYLHTQRPQEAEACFQKIGRPAWGALYEQGLYYFDDRQYARASECWVPLWNGTNVLEAADRKNLLELGQNLLRAQLRQGQTDMAVDTLASLVQRKAGKRGLAELLAKELETSQDAASTCDAFARAWAARSRKESAVELIRAVEELIGGEPTKTALHEYFVRNSAQSLEACRQRWGNLVHQMRPPSPHALQEVFGQDWSRLPADVQARFLADIASALIERVVSPVTAREFLKAVKNVLKRNLSPSALAALTQAFEQLLGGEGQPRQNISRLLSKDSRLLIDITECSRTIEAKSIARADQERTESAYERAREELAALENEVQGKDLSGLAVFDLEARTAALEELLTASPVPANSERYLGLRERFTALRIQVGKQRAAKAQSQEAWEKWRRQQEEAKSNWENSSEGQHWMAERAQRAASAVKKDALRASYRRILQRPDPKAVAEDLRNQAGFWMRTAMLIATQKGKGKSVEELLEIVLDLTARKIPPAQQYDEALGMLRSSPTSTETPRATRGAAKIETSPKMEGITPAMVILLDLALTPPVVLHQHPTGVVLALLTAMAGAMSSATAVTPMFAQAAHWTGRFFEGAVSPPPLKKGPLVPPSPPLDRSFLRKTSRLTVLRYCFCTGRCRLSTWRGPN